MALLQAAEFQALPRQHLDHADAQEGARVHVGTLAPDVCILPIEIPRSREDADPSRNIRHAGDEVELFRRVQIHCGQANRARRPDIGDALNMCDNEVDPNLLMVVRRHPRHCPRPETHGLVTQLHSEPEECLKPRHDRFEVHRLGQGVHVAHGNDVHCLVRAVRSEGNGSSEGVIGLRFLQLHPPCASFRELLQLPRLRRLLQRMLDAPTFPSHGTHCQSHEVPWVIQALVVQDDVGRGTSSGRWAAIQRLVGDGLTIGLVAVLEALYSSLADPASAPPGTRS
mmetsp:Transcript_39044/g.112770  ORF Transcript_39044/g.112770 Transcript_39044/m.112770 type:complete len:283 (+) Transcript_39044:218-1066(+)